MPIDYSGLATRDGVSGEPTPENIRKYLEAKYDSPGSRMIEYTEDSCSESGAPTLQKGVVIDPHATWSEQEEKGKIQKYDLYITEEDHDFIVHARHKLEFAFMEIGAALLTEHGWPLEKYEVASPEAIAFLYYKSQWANSLDPDRNPGYLYENKPWKEIISPEMESSIRARVEEGWKVWEKQCEPDSSGKKK